MMKSAIFALLVACGVSTSAVSMEESSVNTQPCVVIDFLDEQLLDQYPEIKAMDPGFIKWNFRPENFPKNSAIEGSLKRIFSQDPKKFTTVYKLTTDDTGVFKNEEGAPNPLLLCSARGFLPGEIVIFRFATKDKKVCKEIEMVPQPAVVNNAQGERVLEANLAIFDLAFTNYMISVQGVKADETYTIKSGSGNETLEYKLTGPQMFAWSPDVKNVAGGVGKIELILSDGTSYTLELPWGAAMNPYAKGEVAYSQDPLYIIKE